MLPSYYSISIQLCEGSADGWSFECHWNNVVSSKVQREVVGIPDVLTFVAKGSGLYHHPKVSDASGVLHDMRVIPPSL